MAGSHESMKQFIKVDVHQELLYLGSLESRVFKFEMCFFM